MHIREPPQPAPPKTGLRLRAEDAEDLAIISACVQDALVSVRDLAYDRVARTFVLVANRFRWEGRAAAEGFGPYERTLCGIAFEAIDGVVYRGFRRNEGDRLLSLLAIQANPVPGGTPAAAMIDLEFAGGATIRLSGSAIRCRARDFGEPWAARRQPGHEVDGAT